MPIYRCHSPQRLLTEAAKGKSAGEMRRIQDENRTRLTEFGLL
jgi:hypothetical protein